MKRSIISKILTIVLTVILTTIAVLGSEYVILGKNSVKLAVLSFLINRIYPAEFNEDYQYKALIASLEDPFSNYYTEEEYLAQYVNRNKYVGIGIIVSLNETDHSIRINSVTSGSPAEEAGLLVGDMIYSADNIIFDETNYKEVANYIRGEENTSVKVEIIRNDEHLVFDIIRKNIVSPCVTGQMYDDTIGIINLSSFGENSAADFEKTYNQLISQGMTKMIINLNNNGGGYLNEAMAISDMFLPSDTLVTYMMDKNGNRHNYSTLEDNEINIPTVILVNRNSASASEMVSGALQHYKKAVLVGEKTFGKGVAQAVIPFMDNTALALTNAQYYLPSDICIHKIGLTPDYEINMDDGGVMQAEKALEILNNQ